MHEANLLEQTKLTCLLMPVTYTLLIPMPMATIVVSVTGKGSPDVRGYQFGANQGKIQR